MAVKKMLKSVEKRIRSTYSSNYKTRFHLKEKNFDGIKELSKEEKIQVNSFWGVYNVKFNLKFIQYYCDLGGYKDYYIPDDIWYNKILPHFNDRALAKSIDDKSLYSLFLTKFNMPRVVVSVIEGRLYDEDYNIINENEALKIINCGCPLVVKPSINSCGGAGIKKISNISKKEFKSMILEYPNLVFQECVVSSKCLSCLNESSLNTIRVCTTILEDGEIIISSATLRMGSGGSIVDNACSGGIFIGINIETGNLYEYGYTRKTGKYVKLAEHPDSHILFNNYHINGFEKVLACVRENAKYLPKTRLLGWDFAIGIHEEPILVEVNIEDHELEMVQVSHGEYYDRDTLRKVLKEVFGSNK